MSFSRTRNSLFEPRQRAIAAFGIDLRQQDLDADVHLQVQRRCDTSMPARIFRAQIAGRVEQADVFVDAHIGAFADDERQRGKLRVVVSVDRRAVGGDDLHGAVLLPQAEGWRSTTSITSRPG